MKRFACVLRSAILGVLCSLTCSLRAQQAIPDSTLVHSMDSVSVSLLTCGPGNKIYSLYGHTAIRVHDRTTGADLAVNYGMFSFGKPFFVLRFVFGLTDYDMGVEDFDDFCQSYIRHGRSITEQVLDLTSEQKLAIWQALQENYLPKNRTYRYNYFYDNCTTRARDIILDNIKDNHHRLVGKDYVNVTTYRREIHRYNERHRWMRFGCDLLLGVKADRRIDNAQQEFLPDNLMDDFDQLVITDGKSYDLRFVKEKHVLSPQADQEDGDGFPLTPNTCMWVFAVIVVGAAIVEYWRGKYFWGLDLSILLGDGLAGLILLAMVFSQHPTVSLNFQILLLNPLSLVFAWPAARDLRRRHMHGYFIFWTSCIVLFLMLGWLQQYAEGMTIVALSLLIRYIIKLLQNKREQ